MGASINALCDLLYYCFTHTTPENKQQAEKVLCIPMDYRCVCVFMFRVGMSRMPECANKYLRLCVSTVYVFCTHGCQHEDDPLTGTRIPKIRIRTRQLPELSQSRIVVRVDSWDANSHYPNGHYVNTLGVYLYVVNCGVYMRL